ncbi:TRAP transporter small permease [Gordonia sp. KTR9]|uniref:TRAP transporter small permease n=1 Tax=Gordonia sp. KTR9 TaxID=337191 RepID=UPI00027DDEA5|nr:TRAP transporter small permease [Gordonia sp. KTR9]AFR49472.1 TRAP-type mannitol/chloroaromatic compound transport system, small permease component [Gordonia sp. KTR9]
MSRPSLAGRALTLAETLAAATLILMMLHVTLNAITRSFFSAPVPNTLEITEYWYMPILALIGFVTAQARREHVSIDLLFRRIPRAAQRWVIVGSHLLSAMVFAGFAWYGASEALHAYDIELTGGVSALTIWPVWILVPVSFAVLAAQFLTTAVRSIASAEYAGQVDPDDDELTPASGTTRRATDDHH